MLVVATLAAAPLGCGDQTLQLETAQSGLTVSRSNMNAEHSNVVMATNTPGAPVRQMFMNNLSNLTSVFIKVGGIPVLGSDTINVKLLDGCGTLRAQASQDFSTSDLTTADSWKWVEVPLGGVAVNHGKYLVLEVYNSLSTKLVLNTNRYEHGRAMVMGASPVAFPEKKQDLMFILGGSVDSSLAWMPDPTSNIVCPSRCFLANPSGTENTMWNPKNHFNVVVRQRSTNAAESGSFWNDYSTPDGNGNGIPDGIDRLKTEIRNMLEGDASNPGLRETYPYNNYFANNNSPAFNARYYPNMNFYIAVENPATDPFQWRGFSYCANADAILSVADPGLIYGASLGGFEGDVSRTAPTGWGQGMRAVLTHEIFGHAVADLDDEYVPDSGPPEMLSAYLPNSLPLSSACNEWCGGTRDVEWLKSQMVADRDYACWSRTASNCTSTGGAAHCRSIGGLPPIPYWGPYKCIPNNVSQYNIGTNCGGAGNQKCYPLAAAGSGAASMNVAQPGGSIMQSFHGQPVAPGFTTPIENHIKDVLDCVLALIPCGANQTRCANLQSRWGTPGSGYENFLSLANACEGNVIRRR